MHQAGCRLRSVAGWRVAGARRCGPRPDAVRTPRRLRQLPFDADLCVGHPVAVEAEGYAGGKVDGGCGRAGEVGGIEHEEVAGVALGVVNQGKDPSVVLGRVRCAGDEHGLACATGTAERSHLAGPALEVVLDEAAVLAGEEHGCVPVAMAAPDDTLVHPGELLSPIVEALLDDLAGGEVDGPALEGGGSLV